MRGDLVHARHKGGAKAALVRKCRPGDLEAREKAALGRAVEAEKQAQAAARELAQANVSIQAGQARLEAAAREIEEAKKVASEARAAAKKSGEEAAEILGRFKAISMTEKEGMQENKK